MYLKGGMSYRQIVEATAVPIAKVQLIINAHIRDMINKKEFNYYTRPTISLRHRLWGKTETYYTEQEYYDLPYIVYSNVDNERIMSSPDRSSFKERLMRINPHPPIKKTYTQAAKGWS